MRSLLRAHLLLERAGQQRVGRQLAAHEQVVVQRQARSEMPRASRITSGSIAVSVERQRVVGPPQPLERGDDLVAKEAVRILERAASARRPTSARRSCASVVGMCRRSQMSSFGSLMKWASDVDRPVRRSRPAFRARRAFSWRLRSSVISAGTKMKSAAPALRTLSIASSRDVRDPGRRAAGSAAAGSARRRCRRERAATSRRAVRGCRATNRR